MKVETMDTCQVVQVPKEVMAKVKICMTHNVMAIQAILGLDSGWHIIFDFSLVMVRVLHFGVLVNGFILESIHWRVRRYHMLTLAFAFV
jgi:hypothetical protein